MSFSTSKPVEFVHRDCGAGVHARIVCDAGHEVAEVRSAVPLDDAQVQRLATALGRATKKNIEVRVVVDPSLMGGIVATIGDTVIDGSVRHRLEQLKGTI